MMRLTLGVRGPRAFGALVALTVWTAPVCRAQDNYEIQVYGSETVARGRTMVELHTNYTLSGRRTVVDGLFPTDHALHETLEITRGLTDWSEIGFYAFTSARSGQGWQWVGDHIRPRVRAPDAWDWPVGASLSAEIGYQRREFSVDTWTLELRPIIDKQMGRWYASFNPTLERSLHGPGTSAGFEFAPNVDIGVDVSRRVNLSVEYYGALGPVHGFEPLADQEHQLFAAINLNVGADWELNAGVGQALTGAGDQRLVKLIVGRRLGRARPAAIPAPSGAAR